MSECYFCRGDAEYTVYVELEETDVPHPVWYRADDVSACGQCVPKGEKMMELAGEASDKKHREPVVQDLETEEGDNSNLRESYAPDTDVGELVRDLDGWWRDELGWTVGRDVTVQFTYSLGGQGLGIIEVQEEWIADDTDFMLHVYLYRVDVDGKAVQLTRMRKTDSYHAVDEVILRLSRLYEIYEKLEAYLGV